MHAARSLVAPPGRRSQARRSSLIEVRAQALHEWLAAPPLLRSALVVRPNHNGRSALPHSGGAMRRPACLSSFPSIAKVSI